MKKVTSPSNKKKRLYKMMKHLCNPLERWWKIDASLMSQEDWQTIFGQPLEISAIGMSEIQIRRWVDGLHSIGFDKERAYWLCLSGCTTTRGTSNGTGSAGWVWFKTLSSVYVGSRNFPVWTDCWIFRWCCGIHWCRADDVGSRLPAILRSAFVHFGVNIPAWMMSDYYRHRSEHACRFSLSLSESGEGWSLGSVIESVDVHLQSTLMFEDVMGRDW